MLRYWQWIGLVLIGMLISACSSGNTVSIEATTEDVPTYQTMSIDELAETIEDTESEFTIVNVHIPYQGEIEGTDYNIAFNDVDQLVSILPNTDTPIVLYCRSGNMSEQASHELIERGYTQVYDVPGGMNAWRSSGRNLINQ